MSYNVYIGSIPIDTREEDLSKFLHKYGDIDLLELKKRPGRISASAKACCRDAEIYNILLSSSLLFRHQKLEIHRFLEKSDLKQSLHDFNLRRILVNNIPGTTSSDVLKECFQRYGAIEEAKMSLDKKIDRPNEPMNYGFITFKEKLSAYLSIMGSNLVGGFVPVVRLHRMKEVGECYYEVRGERVYAKDLVNIQLGLEEKHKIDDLFDSMQESLNHSKKKDILNLEPVDRQGKSTICEEEPQELDDSATAVETLQKDKLQIVKAHPTQNARSAKRIKISKRKRKRKRNQNKISASEYKQNEQGINIKIYENAIQQANDEKECIHINTLLASKSIDIYISSKLNTSKLVDGLNSRSETSITAKNNYQTNIMDVSEDRKHLSNAFQFKRYLPDEYIHEDKDYFSLSAFRRGYNRNIIHSVGVLNRIQRANSLCVPLKIADQPIRVLDDYQNPSKKLLNHPQQQPRSNDGIPLSVQKRGQNHLKKHPSNVPIIECHNELYSEGSDDSEYEMRDVTDFVDKVVDELTNE